MRSRTRKQYIKLAKYQLIIQHQIILFYPRLLIPKLTYHFYYSIFSTDSHVKKAQLLCLLQLKILKQITKKSKAKQVKRI